MQTFLQYALKSDISNPTSCSTALLLLGVVMVKALELLHCLHF